MCLEFLKHALLPLVLLMGCHFIWNSYSALCVGIHNFNLISWYSSKNILLTWFFHQFQGDRWKIVNSILIANFYAWAFFSKSPFKPSLFITFSSVAGFEHNKSKLSKLSIIFSTFRLCLSRPDGKLELGQFSLKLEFLNFWEERDWQYKNKTNRRVETCLLDRYSLQ